MITSVHDVSDANGYAAIADRLRNWIVGEGLAPGDALPKQTELAAHFAVSPLTIGRAMRELQDDGFVVAIRRAGTFIAESPPHLCRYALIFPYGPPQQGRAWNRFWMALSNEAQVIDREDSRSMPVFCDVDGHTDSPGYQRLLQDLQARRLAGLIFAFPPDRLLETELFADPDLPRVALMTASARLPGLTSVALDGASFIHRAIDYLASQGRRRVAVLTVPTPDNAAALARVHAALDARGMTTRPYWTQIISPDIGYAAENAAHLLLTPSQSPDGAIERPDALLITDDNLVESASRGLLAAGVRVPDDLDVVAHCNFPWPTASVLPCRRLGYDARQVLRQCMAQIDRQQQGNHTATHTPIPAVFEDELGGPPPTV